MDKLRYEDLSPLFKSVVGEIFYEKLTPSASAYILVLFYIGLAQAILKKWYAEYIERK